MDAFFWTKISSFEREEARLEILNILSGFKMLGLYDPLVSLRLQGWDT